MSLSLALPLPPDPLFSPFELHSCILSETFYCEPCGMLLKIQPRTDSFILMELTALMGDTDAVLFLVGF